MIVLAKMRSEKHGTSHLTEYVEADAENIPLRQNSIDITLSITVLNLLENQQQALREIDRVTKYKAVITILKSVELGVALASLNIGILVGETDKDYIFVRDTMK